MVAALDPQKWTLYPNSWSSFFTARRKATQFAAWFVLTYWCYIVCLFYRWILISAFSLVSQVFWNIIRVFIFFKVQFYNESRNLYEYLGTEISNKSLHAGLALCSNLMSFCFLFCFILFGVFYFYIPHSHIDICCFQAHLIPVESLIIPSLFLQSQDPQQCLHRSYMAACEFEKTVTNCLEAKKRKKNINVTQSALLEPLP